MTTPKPAAIVNGEPWWDFVYDYDMEGTTYSFHVRARSYADADARLKKMALARCMGQCDGRPIPLLAGGFLAPLIVWWRNARIRWGSR